MTLNIFKPFFLQMPPGLNLMFGPDPLPLPLKFKRTKTLRKKVKSRTKAERTRVKDERQKRRAERLERRASRRAEEKKGRAERGEPEVSKPKRSVRKSSHGTEEVDAIILKVLGRSQKSKKVASKFKNRMVKKEEVAGPTWRHGMQEERHEVRSGKARQEKSQRKKLKASQVSGGAGNIGKIKTVKEKQPKSDFCQVLPIIDAGPDYEADGGHLESNGDGAEALAWPLAPDCAAPSCGEEAAELASPPLPAQNLLSPEAFCMKFYQVRNNFVSLTLKHG